MAKMAKLTSRLENDASDASSTSSTSLLVDELLDGDDEVEDGTFTAQSPQ